MAVWPSPSNAAERFMRAGAPAPVGLRRRRTTRSGATASFPTTPELPGSTACRLFYVKDVVWGSGLGGLYCGGGAWEPAWACGARSPRRRPSPRSSAASSSGVGPCHGSYQVIARLRGLVVPVDDDVAEHAANTDRSLAVVRAGRCRRSPAPSRPSGWRPASAPIIGLVSHRVGQRPTPEKGDQS